jgi:GNAT superfamily N-acetyltransferase
VAASLVDVDLSTVVRFYDDVLQPSFAQAELLGLEDLILGRLTGAIRGTMLLRRDRPVAGMVTGDYVDGNVRLLAYLAVRPADRDQGLGAELLRGLTPARPSGLVLAEIDDPRLHTAGNHGDPSARLHFYERHGWRLLPLPHVQPGLRPGSPPQYGKLLIAMESAAKHVDSSLLRAFLEQYLNPAGGPEHRLDEAVHRALHAAATAPEGRLRLFPLAELTAARPAAE